MTLSLEQAEALFGRMLDGAMDDDAIAASPAADPDGPAFEFAVERDLATGEETVAIHMQNPVVRSGAHKSRPRSFGSLHSKENSGYQQEILCLG